MLPKTPRPPQTRRQLCTTSPCAQTFALILYTSQNLECRFLLLHIVQNGQTLEKVVSLEDHKDKEFTLFFGAWMQC